WERTRSRIFGSTEEVPIASCSTPSMASVTWFRPSEWGTKSRVGICAVLSRIARGKGQEMSHASKSKACREKIRRDRLNKRFIELSSILDPGRPPRADKASILGDATRVLMRLRAEAQELKESNNKLHEAIKDMKVEKNELREEKMRLKADKDRIEQQIKVSSVPPAGFLPHPMAFHPAFVPQVQASADKTTPFSGFPGMAMWQWLPPAVMDTTQDPKLWPPNA
ncbi:unnamed protein product, partial [Musa textilis]